LTHLHWLEETAWRFGKADCDGAYKESLDIAGCGGFIRDSNS